MNVNNEMNVNDLANMLCAAVNAEMRIRLHNDIIEVSGGTALYIVDMYILLKALEVVAANTLPMMTSADDLKEALKKSIDLFDFNAKTEEETNVTR
jgi:hypothetical protein